MKMFKKIMAVVLTGVMAASMLTGCALGDAAKQSALVKALNNEEVQKTVTYKSENYQSAGKNIWEDKTNGLNDGAAAAEAKKGTYKKSNGTEYVYYVTVVPEDAKKSASWAATKAHDIDTYLQANAEKTGNGTKKKIEIDVYFDDYKAAGAEKTTHYAVVIAKKAASTSTAA